jgi:putative sterol carrier protein
MTLDELFEKITSKVTDLDIEAPFKEASVILNIEGEEERVWFVDFKEKKVTLKEYQADEEIEASPDVVVSVSENTLISLATRKMSPTWAFMTGKVRVEGNLDLVGQLGKIWPDL